MAKNEDEENKLAQLNEAIILFENVRSADERFKFTQKEKQAFKFISEFLEKSFN
jgi:hypothetical protein